MVHQGAYAFSPSRIRFFYHYKNKKYMEKNTTVIAGAMLIIGVVIGFLLSGKGASNDETGMHQMPDGSTMTQSIDQHFIIEMIPHHEGAIEMAKVALEKSKRPEIISLANDIIAAQSREITEMTTWYGSWFEGAVPEGGMGGMHMSGMTGDLDDLNTVSSADFDREFIDQMIPHHEMAIMMANMLATASERTEMKQLASAIITSQSREIEMMKSWRKAWYGK